MKLNSFFAIHTTESLQRAGIMKKLFIFNAFVLMFLFVPFVMQAQWVLQTTLDGNPPLQAVKAINEDIAWTCSGNGYVYRTTDSGQNWERTTQVSSSEMTFVIEGVDSDIAFIGGAGPNFAGNANLYRTIDGGQSWEVVYTAVGPTSFWNMIHFFDTQNGIALSDPPNGAGAFLIIKTKDGGTTWTPISNPPMAKPGETGLSNAFQFYDDKNGWFGTYHGGRIFRTTDGGETWTGFASGGSGSTWSVNFVSPTTGVRTSDSAPFLSWTTDGGQTWTPVTDLPVSDITLMQAGAVISTSEGNQIWVSGEATSASTPFMITSTDGGQTWLQQKLPPLSGNSIQTMSAVTFGDAVDSVQVWAITLDHSDFESGGQILSYAGVVAAVDEQPTIGISDFRLEQNYPNPFNPSTVIRYNLSKSVHVNLAIFDILGRKVRTLVDAAKPAGPHETTWDGRNDVGAQVSNGVYMYSIEAGTFIRTRKLTLIR